MRDLLQYWCVDEKKFEGYGVCGKLNIVSGFHVTVIETLIRETKDERVINFLQGAIAGIKITRDLALKADGQ